MALIERIEKRISTDIQPSAYMMDECVGVYIDAGVAAIGREKRKVSQESIYDSRVKERKKS